MCIVLWKYVCNIFRPIPFSLKHGVKATNHECHERDKNNVYSLKIFLPLFWLLSTTEMAVLT